MIVKNIDDLSLCLVTRIADQQLDEYLSFILSCVQGGVTSVQLRIKQGSFAEWLVWGKALKQCLAPTGTPFIVNDSVALAQEIDADGVHLGQQDMSVAQARKILGPDKWIGWSVETWAQLEQANLSSDMDYIAASAIFPSVTKKNCATYWGIDGLKSICQHSRHPVVAIGGIEVEHIPQLTACGIAGIAVVSSIHDAPIPEQKAAMFRWHMEKKS